MKIICLLKVRNKIKTKKIKNMVNIQKPLLKKLMCIEGLKPGK